MSEPIRIRVQTQGEISDIRILLQHPMETGLRKDERGRTWPTHFIQHVTVKLNGKAIIDGQLNTAIAKNPLFTFKARDIKAGDTLSVAWTDNRGEHRQDEITVA